MKAFPPSVRAYLDRVGAETLAPQKAMIRDWHGDYYHEKAMIRLSNSGVYCTVEDYAPTEEEAKQMALDLEGYPFPHSVLTPDLEGLDQTEWGPEWYTFHSHEKPHHIIMVQQVCRNPKAHLPWVVMDDGEWQQSEPDGALPFWLPWKGEVGTGRAIMVHEGAKAASNCQRIVDEKDTSHPWYEWLKQYTHIGMIGGALAPHRSDYRMLKALQPSQLVYVCDNDLPGKAALPMVSRQWKAPMEGLYFPNSFPEAFDLGDPMPANLFAPNGRYIGPRPEDMLRPATWATIAITPEKGRTYHVASKDFISQWKHTIHPEVFVNLKRPHLLYAPVEFNSAVRPYSHVDDTARILRASDEVKSLNLGYDPGQPAGEAVVDGEATLNTYAAPGIKPDTTVDQGPWIDFLEQLVPDRVERHEVSRWLATLIARPGNRMGYGLLLISETQGVGKSTLGERVLIPLVGISNCSIPSEQEVVDSQFNSWAARKRLVVVHEIYQGRNQKAYDRLKSYITDQYINVNEKFQRPYRVRNWVHMFACSNSPQALVVAGDDRRWLVPRVTEQKMGGAWWQRFHDWLELEGGLAGIMAWAEAYVTEHGAVIPGEEAPFTARKGELVVDGYTEGQQLAEQVLIKLRVQIERGELPEETFIYDTQLRERIRNEIHEGKPSARVDSAYSLRKIASGLGFHVGSERVRSTALPKSCWTGRAISLRQDVATLPTPDLIERGAPIDITQPGA